MIQFVSSIFRCQHCLLAHLIIDDDITELVFAILQRGIEVTMDAWSDRHEFSNLAGLRQKIAGLLRDGRVME